MVRTRLSSGSGSPISTSPRVRGTVSSPTDGAHLVHPSQHVPTHEPLDEVAAVEVLEEGQCLAGPVRLAGHQLVAAGQDAAGDQQTDVFAGAEAVSPRGARSRCRCSRGWVPHVAAVQHGDHVRHPAERRGKRAGDRDVPARR